MGSATKPRAPSPPQFRATMRCMKCCSFAALLSLFIAAGALAPSPARAQDANDPQALDKSLHDYSVRVVKTRVFQHESLNGIYLGRGAVLTAAHVVGRFHLLKELHVRIAGQELPAKIVKEGSLEKTDLTVLSIDEEQLPVRLRLRLNPVCREPLKVGQEVVVVAALGTARSRVHFPAACAGLGAAEVRHRHQRCADRHVRIRRVRRQQAMPARHHQPKDHAA